MMTYVLGINIEANITVNNALKRISVHYVCRAHQQYCC